MKNNKKAISPIIATVIIISMVFVIGVIVYNFSTNFLEKQTKNTEEIPNYYDVELSILMELGSSTLLSLDNGDKLSLGVMRIDNQDSSNWTSDEKKNILIKGIRFNFKDNKGNSYSHDVYSAPPVMTGFTYPYKISLEESGAQSWNSIEEISIMLIYGQEKVTRILDEIIIE
jgi:flagellin-like protein